MFQAFGHGSEESARASIPEYIDNVEGNNLLTYWRSHLLTRLCKGLYNAYIGDETNNISLRYNASELLAVVPITLRKTGTVLYIHKLDDLADVAQNFLDRFSLDSIRYSLHH